MIAWIVVAVILGTLMNLFFEGYMSSWLRRDWDRRLAKYDFLTRLCVSLYFAILAALPFFVEFPRVPFLEETTVVTFAENGDLVYHPWGLWTPPWSKREVANVPTDCSRPYGYTVNVDMLFEKDSKVYQVQFSADVCVVDPKVYFEDRRRRNQDFKDPAGLQYVAEDVVQKLILMQASNADAIKAVAKERCEFKPVMYQVDCQAVSDYIKDAAEVRPILRRNGLELKLQSAITLTNLVN